MTIQFTPYSNTFYAALAPESTQASTDKDVPDHVWKSIEAKATEMLGGDADLPILHGAHLDFQWKGYVKHLMALEPLVIAYRKFYKDTVSTIETGARWKAADRYLEYIQFAKEAVRPYADIKPDNVNLNSLAAVRTLSQEIEDDITPVTEYMEGLGLALDNENAFSSGLAKFVQRYVSWANEVQMFDSYHTAPIGVLHKQSDFGRALKEQKLAVNTLLQTKVQPALKVEESYLRACLTVKYKNDTKKVESEFAKFQPDLLLLQEATERVLKNNTELKKPEDSYALNKEFRDVYKAYADVVHKQLGSLYQAGVVGEVSKFKSDKIAAWTLLADTKANHLDIFVQNLGYEHSWMDYPNSAF
jgi:hypothetical protein